MARLITIAYNQMLQSWLLNSVIDFKFPRSTKFSKWTMYMVKIGCNIGNNIPVYDVTKIGQLVNTISYFFLEKLSGCKSCKVQATSSGSPNILISCTSTVYMYGSLHQGIKPFHFPAVILFY